MAVLDDVALDGRLDGVRHPIGSLRRWTRASVAEILDNTMDAAHFPYVHGTSAPPELRLSTADGRWRVDGLFAPEPGRPRLRTTFVADTPERAMTVVRAGVTLLVAARHEPVDGGTAIHWEAFVVAELLSGTRRRYGEVLLATLTHQLEADIAIWDHRCREHVPCAPAVDAWLARHGAAAAG